MKKKMKIYIDIVFSHLIVNYKKSDDISISNDIFIEVDNTEYL